jgi:hypothetical protein
MRIAHDAHETVRSFQHRQGLSRHRKLAADRIRYQLEGRFDAAAQHAVNGRLIKAAVK